MPARNPDQRRLVSQIAAASRWGSGDVDAARRDLAASRAEEYIARLVASAPPLTSEQRSKLAVLLLGGVAA